MKATGIVRRIDDLGRVVVPKEIRKTLRIREGDPLEIFTDREGKIILKKYSPVGELGANAAILAESIARTLGCTVCITDLDQVVAASGAGSRELKGQYISDLKNAMGVGIPGTGMIGLPIAVSLGALIGKPEYQQIGRASCRERV